MTKEKFSSMIEDAHKNKVLHLVKLFILENGYEPRLYDYIRKSNNEPETIAILNTLGIETPEQKFKKAEETAYQYLKNKREEGHKLADVILPRTDEEYIKAR